MNGVTQPVLGRYSCPACPVRFTSLADKKEHIRLQHADTKKKAKR